MVYIILLTRSFPIPMSSGISFEIIPTSNGRGEARPLPFLTRGRKPEEPPLPAPSSSGRRRRGRVRNRDCQIVAIGSRPSRPPSSFWGNLLVGGMSVAIMAMSLSALMGTDPTSPQIPPPSLGSNSGG